MYRNDSATEAAAKSSRPRTDHHLKECLLSELCSSDSSLVQSLGARAVPTVIVISNGDHAGFNHPRQEVLNRYFVLKVSLALLQIPPACPHEAMGWNYLSFPFQHLI